MLKAYQCTCCNRTLKSDQGWLDHLLSKGHQEKRSAAGNDVTFWDKTSKVTLTAISDVSPMKLLRYVADFGHVEDFWWVSHIYGETCFCLFADETAAMTLPKVVKDGEIRFEIKPPLGVSDEVAIDVEMAEVRDPSKPSGVTQVPIKVSIVDYDGNFIYDRFVKVREGHQVRDFKTGIHGIKSQSKSYKNNRKDYFEVREEIKDILIGKLVVGHSIMNDLKAFELVNLAKQGWFRLKCTATAEFLRKKDGGSRKLSDLASKCLNMKIQIGSHDSNEDAKCAMMLYRKFQHKPVGEWGDPLVEDKKKKKNRLCSYESRSSASDSFAE